MQILKKKKNQATKHASHPVTSGCSIFSNPKSNNLPPDAFISYIFFNIVL